MMSEEVKNKPKRRNKAKLPRESEDEHIRLMYQAAKGDRAAYARIYEVYRPAILKYLLSLNGQCSEHDLDDMIQEVFFRGWKKVDKFQGKSSVKTYLFGFTRYVWREHLNLHAKEDSKKHIRAQENSKVGTASPAERVLCNREAIRKLKKAIGRLSRKQQQVLDIILEDRDISMANASRSAGLSESAYRKMLSIAKKKLRDVCHAEDFT